MNIRKSAGALLALCAANAFAAEVVENSDTSKANTDYLAVR